MARLDHPLRLFPDASINRIWELSGELEEAIRLPQSREVQIQLRNQLRQASDLVPTSEIGNPLRFTPFIQAGEMNYPLGAGIYLIQSEVGRCCYIGLAGNFRVRFFRNDHGHYSENNSTS